MGVGTGVGAKSWWGCGGWVLGVARGSCVLSCESHIIRHTESGERERERGVG